MVVGIMQMTSVQALLFIIYSRTRNTREEEEGGGGGEW